MINDWAQKCAEAICKHVAQTDTYIPEDIAAIIAAFAEPLMKLLQESKREHYKDQIDSLDDCPILIGEKSCKSMMMKYECTCGADEWNAKVDAVLNGEKK